MNNFNIMSELQRCVNKTTEGEWAVWFKGRYLGTIKYENHFYSVYTVQDRLAGKTHSFMSSLSKFIDTAKLIVRQEEKAEAERWVDAVTRETVFRTWGLREPKTLWHKVKGLFK